MHMPKLGMTERDVLPQWSTHIAKAGLDREARRNSSTFSVRIWFDLETVEVSRDVVDSERSDRFFIWREATAAAEAASIALPLFEHALENRLPMFRYQAGGSVPFADAKILRRIISESGADVILFARHINPAAALGLSMMS
jgi:hypothetical protein